MTILWSNNASSTVSGSITAVSTSVALAAGTGVIFPQPSGTDYFVATFYDQATKTQYEIVHVTSVVGDVATIVRAQEGTTAQPWNAGDIFANLVTAGTLRNFVQSGAGPAPTSIVYVGVDTSITPNLVICNTVPVPANYAIGMLFNIKINNNNTGPVQLQFNGVAPTTATRTDGSPMVGGNLIASEEMIFIFNGMNFTSMVPPIPQQPPQTTFYVRTDGNDNNSGFANTPAAAFRTISGAMSQIKSRYISQNQITIRVADGLYIDAIWELYSYIASWNIIGNPTNPGNVVVQATSVSSGAYPPYVPTNLVGRPCSSGHSGNITVNGFTFQSYIENVTTYGGGIMFIYNCNFTAPTSGNEAAIIAHAGSTMEVYGTCQYSGAVSAVAIFVAEDGSNMLLGYKDEVSTNPLTFNINGTPIITSATAIASAGGEILVYTPVTVFTGGIPNCKQYTASSAGGISFGGGVTTILPGTQPGVVYPPGWTA